MNTTINHRNLFASFIKSRPHEPLLHPWDSNEMVWWSRKLGVSYKQLNDAVIDTGSLSVDTIRKYLKEKEVLFSMKKVWHALTRIMHTSANNTTEHSKPIKQKDYGSAQRKNRDENAFGLYE
jgi:hypothetical protein